MFGKMGAELARRVRLMMYNNILHQEVGDTSVACVLNLLLRTH